MRKFDSEDVDRIDAVNKHLADMRFNIKELTGYSMEGAAKQGAHPCPECILKRYNYYFLH